jgi:hypothetical protein
MSRRIPSLLAAAAAAALLAPASAAAQRVAHAAEAPKAAAPAADTLKPRPGATPEGATGVLTFERESYAYARDGRRDPFSSLLDNGELRPLLSDLSLAVVAYDPSGGSVAVLRDLNTKEQYRVRVGQQLGRMRVAGIEAKRITFTIEEFGFSRQETLALSDTTTSRTQQ